MKRTFPPIRQVKIITVFFLAAANALLMNCRKVTLKETSAAASESNAAIGQRKPNIIVIMGDDLGYEVPTVNGGQSYETPNMDLLARKGMRFTQCHSSPFCAPSRWMLVTGKYNFRNFNQYGVLGTDQRTIANMLHDNGYTTGVYGKWAMDGGDTSIHIFGFDQYAIWNPYKDFEGDHENKGSHYKSPSIYDNGNFIADSLTEGKYGDDIFTDSVMNFIEA
ncbi:MAG: sulfatase-like hydrolase/transferase, partial [Panacibacter sp.]